MKRLIPTMLLLFSSNALTDSHKVEIELAKILSSDYQRPYVAIWVSNKDKHSTQVLQLWYERDRWLKDLKYFWRRILRKQPKSIDGVTGATRGPGTHQFNWDGKDLKPGIYKLCAEVAREHGGRTAKCMDFHLPLNQAQQITLEGEFTKLRIEEN